MTIASGTGSAHCEWAWRATGSGRLWAGGRRNYRSAWGRHITSEEYSGRIVDQAHNKAVDTLVATGTVGFFIYVLLWLALALTAARLALDREGPDRRFALAMAAALARLPGDQPVPVRHPVFHVAVRAAGGLLRLPGIRPCRSAGSLAGSGPAVCATVGWTGPPAARPAGSVFSGGSAGGRQPGPVVGPALPGRSEHEIGGDLGAHADGSPPELSDISRRWPRTAGMP